MYHFHFHPAYLAYLSLSPYLLWTLLGVLPHPQVAALKPFHTTYKHPESDKQQTQLHLFENNPKIQTSHSNLYVMGC